MTESNEPVFEKPQEQSIPDPGQELSELKEITYMNMVALLRIYDVLMLILENNGDTNEILAAHAAGKLLGPAPIIDMPTWS